MSGAEATSGEGASRDKAVLVRSGGLGDFILALPLLQTLRERYAQTLLVTRPGYFPLVPRPNAGDLRFAEADAFSPASHSSADFLCGADVFTFWRDAEWEEELRATGARKVRTLESRPTGPPHVVERAFADACLPAPADLFERAWLAEEAGKVGKAEEGGETPASGARLWIHPGSGSASKNVPLAFFEKEARKWLDGAGREDGSVEEARVTFSFGEADGRVEEAFRASALFGAEGVEAARPASLAELRLRLQKEAVRFLGNDSGPAHLAAALGLPVEVVFTTTDPAVWRPLGPDVRIRGADG